MYIQIDLNWIFDGLFGDQTAHSYEQCSDQKG